jgi:hypothetical protein
MADDVVREARVRERRPGAVDRSRATMKPRIPEVGAHGIPLRDGREPEVPLDPVAGRA